MRLGLPKRWKDIKGPRKNYKPKQNFLIVGIVFLLRQQKVLSVLDDEEAKNLANKPLKLMKMTSDCRREKQH